MESHAALICEIPTLNLLRVLVRSAYEYNLQFRRDFPKTPRLVQMARFMPEERQRLTVELESNQAVKIFQAKGFEDIKTVDRMVREYEKYGVTLVDCEDVISEWCAEETFYGRLCYPEIYTLENNEGRRNGHVMALFPDGMKIDASRFFGMPAAREGESIEIIAP